MIIEVDETRMDIKHHVAIFLQTLHDFGGEANTRDIVERSGLEDWRVNEAWKQAEDMGLARWTGTYDDASRGPGSDPKLYELTGHGRQVVERGVPGQVISINDTETALPHEELEKLRKMVTRLERRLDATQQQDLDDQFEALRSQLEAADLTEEERGALNDAISELEDYVFEWTSFAETYFLALRRIIEREIDVDFEQELAEVQEHEVFQ